MELTLDQALQKGIELHRAGEIQDAERLYTLILKAQPHNPDANHNMGVLVNGVGKIQEALPFFKTALEAKPSFGQFWLSYIDILIKLGKIDDAKAVFDLAKNKGANGAIFDQIEQQLAEKGLYGNETNTMEAQVSSSSRPNILDTIKLDEALRLAKKNSKEGHFEEAKNIYGDILQKFPKNKRALIALQSLVKGTTPTQQNPTPEKLQPVINLFNRGQFHQAVSEATQMLKEYPNSFVLYNFVGASNAELMKFDAAIHSFKQAQKIKPDFAGSFVNMGKALQDKGDPGAAIDSYKQALEIKPDYAEAYNYIGVSLFEMNDNDLAIVNYKQALDINPDYSAPYYNMGIALNVKGDLKASLHSFKQALRINPDHAKAYNNMGACQQNMGDVNAAKASYKEALRINPEYADAAWNRHGLAENISEAKSWITYCLKLDQSHLHAKLTLSALKFYEGHKSDFNDLIESSLKNHPYMRSFSWAFNLPELPELHFNKWALFDQVVGQSEKNRPFYEFGVWRGESFKYLMKTFKKGYGFDSFVGLPEDWHHEKAGSYSSDGNIPQIEGGEFILGIFDDTLPAFFSEPRSVASVINFDADLYSSTLCALNCAKSVIDQYTILIFDEFIMNKHWEEDEYKALNEFCLQNSYTYEVLAISFFTGQAAVRLVGI